MGLREDQDADRCGTFPEGIHGMRYLSFDSVGGASGDMLLGALIDLGVEVDKLNATIEQIVPEPLKIAKQAAADGGLQGTRATVAAPGAADTKWLESSSGDNEPHRHHHHHAHRGLVEILTLLEHPALSSFARDLASAVFRRLAEVEAGIHGVRPETIHFHEVGAADAIADIVGCCLALEQLEIEAVRVGPLPSGCGTLQCAHGEMPNPAPATLRLLEGFDLVQTDEPHELVTPTAAALFATWREKLAQAPVYGRPVRSGFGFGQRKLCRRANVLRATLMASQDETIVGTPSAGESLRVLETNLDDCRPEWIGDLIERLLSGGALDAWATPIVMKKGRPAQKVSALCRSGTVAPLRRLIFMTSTTFGVRDWPVERVALERRVIKVATPHGEMRIKQGLLDGRVITSKPEFDDCVRLAAAAGIAPRKVYEASLRCIDASDAPSPDFQEL